MKISGEISDILGKDTGEAYKLICSKDCDRLGKREWIKKYFKNRGATIIDVGCCGHLMNIDNQIKNGTWLHGELDNLTTENWGVDINETACEYLTETYGRKDIIAGNILTDGEKVKNFIGGGQKDYILLADVIEHTDDPIGFLKGIGNQKYAEKIVITVPNAFHFVNLWFAGKNMEVINSDHKFWFTPYTLMKCCNEAGIIVEELDFTGFRFKGHRMPKWLCKNIMGTTICLVGKWKSER